MPSRGICKINGILSYRTCSFHTDIPEVSLIQEGHDRTALLYSTSNDTGSAHVHTWSAWRDGGQCGDT